MTHFQITPIDQEVADAVRASLLSPDYGHPAKVETAAGFGPCRSCLRTFDEGAENRVLFTFNPFRGREPYPAPGPVFIHETPCESYADSSKFPETLRGLALTFEGYAAGRRLIEEVHLREPEVEAAIERLFANSEIDYIHVRNTDAGCYVLRIEREGA